jgi:hypothetical protein
MIVNDATCLFCAEDETVNHLFFYCCVAELSGKIYLICGHSFGYSVARLWLSDKKHRNVNVCTTAALWSLEIRK